MQNWCDECGVRIPYRPWGPNRCDACDAIVNVYDCEEPEEPANKEYAEMQDGEVVPVYEYHYTGTVHIWQ